MLQIEAWFPIHIGYVFNPFHKEIEDKLTQQCLKMKKSYKKDFEEFRKISNRNDSQSPLLDWLHFQNDQPYKILEDQQFSRLHNWIDDQVEEYAKTFSITTPTLELKCVGGWFNIFEKYDFQDYHNHRPNILSCVYFLNCEEEIGAKLMFKNTNDSLVDYCSSESSLLPMIFHQPFPGKLVIFSSHLEHSVQQQNTNNTRITLAYNYK